MFIQTDNFGSADEFRFRIHKEGYSYPMHLHQYAELMLVLSGEIDVSVDGKRERAKEGDFIFIFPFQPHEYSTPSYSDTFCAVFSPSLAADFFEGARGRVGDGAVFSASPLAHSSFRELIGGGGGEYLPRACLYLAIDDLKRQILLRPRRENAHLAEKMIKYLDANACYDIALADMAGELGYSENYLSHSISSLFGMNFRTLLACFRVERAKRLLRLGNMSVIEIALECGFGNERTFDRAFKRITNQTPSAYAKKQ